MTAESAVGGRLTEQSPTATTEPIDKGCTADARTLAGHGAGGALLPSAGPAGGTAAGEGRP